MMSVRRKRDKTSKGELRMLSDAIRVTPINSSNIRLPTRVIGNRRNYEEFKSVYQANLKESVSTQKTPPMGSYCTIDPLQCAFRRLLLNPEPKYPNFINTTTLKPIKPTKELKTVKVPVPKEGNRNAIVTLDTKKLSKNIANNMTTRTKTYNTPYIIPKKETADKMIGSAHAFIEKLRDLEKAEHLDSSHDLIAQANKEIHIASTQIEQIQDLLKSRISQISREAKAEAADSATPKWNTEKHHGSDPECRKKKLEEAFHSEKHKVVTALNTLNRKLQNMQEKYFKHPHIRYRSIRDTPSRSVEMIFKNRNFEETSGTKREISTSPEPKQQSSILQNKPNTTDFRNLIEPEVPKSANESVVIKPKVFLESNTKIDRRSDTFVKTKTTKIPIRAPTTRKVLTRYPVNESPRQDANKEQGDISKDVEKAKSREDGDSNLLQDIEENILRSDFLSKEFRIDPVKGIREENERGEAGFMRQPNPRYKNPSGLKYDSAPDKKEREKNLEHNINMALKDSLFTTK